MSSEENEKAIVCGLLKLPLFSMTLINTCKHHKLPACLHMGVQWMNVDVCFLICWGRYDAKKILKSVDDSGISGTSVMGVSQSPKSLWDLCWEIWVLGHVQFLYIVKTIYFEIGLGGVKLLLLLKKSRLYVDLVQAFNIMKALYKLEQDKWITTEEL